MLYCVLYVEITNGEKELPTLLEKAFVQILLLLLLLLLLLFVACQNFGRVFLVTYDVASRSVTRTSITQMQSLASLVPSDGVVQSKTWNFYLLFLVFDDLQGVGANYWYQRLVRLGLQLEGFSTMCDKLVAKFFLGWSRLSSWRWMTRQVRQLCICIIRQACSNPQNRTGRSVSGRR